MRKLYALAAAAAAAAILGAAPAQAAVTVLSTGFDDVGALGGWSFANQSAPPGSSWFQGNSGVFPAHAGAADSYVAANFLSVADGSHPVDNWMITPQLSLPGKATLTFYARGTNMAGFSDLLEVYYSTGGGAIGDFSNFALAVPFPSGMPSAWRQYSVTVDPGPAGRFAFRYYTATGDTADYIGVDSLTVAAVPEPSAWLMLGGGLALLLWRVRRASPSPRRKSSRPGLLACLSLLAVASGAIAAAQEGMIMVRDAETGLMRPATPAEFAALRGQEVRVPVIPPQVYRRPDGSRQSRVNTRAVYSVATRDADGKLVTTCVEGADAASAAVQRGGIGIQSSGSASSEEHSHDHR